MEINTFRRYAHQCADWMADYLGSVETYPVRSQVEPGEIATQIAASCPQQGESMDRILADFERVILPGITHWQHPRFFAYFNANSSPPSVLAEMLTATLAAQCMLWETSPAATELEERMTVWLRDLIGLPTEFTGSIQDSGSASNLCAILAACEHASGGRFSREGLAGGPPLTVYASAEAHSSIEKGARIAGIGRQNVRQIPVRDDYGMDPNALAAAIQQDRNRGLIPACIVACYGATGLGSVDSITEIGAIARAQDVHLHVDAAWAGSALILPEIRTQLQGLEEVNSFVFNPHKWLFTNFDCSAFYMRDPSRLLSALSLTPSYLESEAGDAMPEYRDWSVALARRFRALKLWFVLRSYGAEGLRAKIRDHIDWTAQLAERIRETQDFELVTEPRLALLSFRYRPAWAQSEAELDQLNQDLLNRINDEGFLYLTKTRARGRLVIRFVIGQTNTTQEHVKQAWSHIQQTAKTIPSDG